MSNDLKIMEERMDNSKLKVGVVTMCSGSNYGNKLQNYAVEQVLANMGFEPYTVPNNLYIKPFKEKVKGAVKFVFNINKERNAVYRQKRFNAFNSEFLHHYNKILTEDDKNNINADFDFFVAGSDQIWNPSSSIGKTGIPFLTFADEKKRISYAASFGVSEIDDIYKEQYKNRISGLKGISVREAAGRDIVEKLTNRQATVVVDPTLMIDGEKWRSIARKPEWFKDDKFILTYFLGKVDEERKNAVNSLADEKNYKVINLLDKNLRDIYAADPCEFLYLIDNAELVCTDSFHACVFSILLNTPFCVFNRLGKEKSMNSRFDTLLGLFNLKDRYYDELKNDKQRIFSSDYNDVDEVLKEQRSIALNFLKENTEDLSV